MKDSVPDEADAQPESAKKGKRKKKKKKKKGWRTTVTVSGEAKYDRNPFLLSSGQKAALRNAGAGEAVSGRFNDMPSTDDVIIMPEVTIQARGPSAGRRDMTLKFKVGYEAFLENTERSHLETQFSLAQETSKHGRVKAAFKFVPDYFRKNYLTGAVDTDGDGDILLPEERRYTRAEYDQWDFSGNYRHRVRNGESTDVFLWGGAGYGKRTYNSIFTTRNRTVPHADAGLLFKGKSWNLALNARLRAVDSPRGLEQLLLDETAFNVDFSADGDMNDLFAATIQSVDRTHTQLIFEFKLESSSTEIKYQRRQRHFSSHEPFDVAHLERSDSRDVVKFGRVFGNPNRTHAKFGTFFARQRTDRVGDPGSAGETTDYRRLGGYFSVNIVF